MISSPDSDINCPGLAWLFFSSGRVIDAFILSSVVSYDIKLSKGIGPSKIYIRCEFDGGLVNPQYFIF